MYSKLNFSAIIGYKCKETARLFIRRLIWEKHILGMLYFWIKELNKRAYLYLKVETNISNKPWEQSSTQVCSVSVRLFIYAGQWGIMDCKVYCIILAVIWCFQNVILTMIFLYNSELLFKYNIPYCFWNLSRWYVLILWKFNLTNTYSNAFEVLF